MAITILDDTMSSDHTTHRARLMPGPAYLWEVSWLPTRRLDRNGAITAMVLADLVGSGDLQADDRQWILRRSPQCGRSPWKRSRTCCTSAATRSTTCSGLGSSAASRSANRDASPNGT